MIQKKDIERMAILAKLEIKEDEIPFYINEIENMLGFAEKIVFEETEEEYEKNEPLDFNDMREDVTSESFEVSEIISNTSEKESNFFKLRKRA